MKDFGKWTQLEQIRARRTGQVRTLQIDNKKVVVITIKGVHERVINKRREKC